MAPIERKWTLLVSKADDRILRTRTGERPNLGPGRDDMEAVVVVPETQLAGAVEAEREWCRQILDVDERDAGDGRLLATLANMAAVRLRELGGQSSLASPPGSGEDRGHDKT